MKTTKLFFLMTLAVTVTLCARLGAQVQTDVPPAVPGAKPVSVEHIKVHGTSLEGNLEGDAVDRDVFVFLPPTYAQAKIPPLPGCLRASRLFHRSRAMDSRNSCTANH